MGHQSLPNRFSISHQGAARGADYEAWRETICRGFCRLDVGPADSEYVDCHNEFVFLHSVAIATPSGNSARFARTRELLSDGCDDLVLIAATRGNVRVTQKGKTVELTTGQVCLTEMNVVGAVDLNAAGEFTTARFPRFQLLQVAPSAETQLGRPLGHDRALSVMIARYSSLCNEIAGELDALGRQAVAQNFSDLVGHFVETGARQWKPPWQRGISAVRLDLLKAEILRNLNGGDLTIEAVSRRNGLSRRQTQRMFASSGTTFSEFVLDQRLLLARRLLRHESARYRKVSDVALSVGFSDLSYFNKSFKRRFGVTPSDVRMKFEANDTSEH